jgi:hypothetical protein
VDLFGPGPTAAAGFGQIRKCACGASGDPRTIKVHGRTRVSCVRVGCAPRCAQISRPRTTRPIHIWRLNSCESLRVGTWSNRW